MNKNEVLLGLSGGIDSEYSAKLLLEEGFSVSGMYINMLGKSVEGVKNVSDKLGIPLYITDKSKEFGENVVSPFADYYQKGKTPNPCVECNRFVKIQTLLEESKKLGIPYIATGHYAKIKKIGDRYCIAKGADAKKDQSYFLWKLTEEQLKVLKFPLGDVLKETLLSEQSYGYKESQDICFIDKDYRDFLTEIGVSSPAGDFLSVDGKIVGRHNGICNYTRGQRKGLGVALGYPAFVTKIDTLTNSITLGKREDLSVRTFWVKDLNFQAVEEFTDEREFNVKTRYRATPILASVKLIDGKARVCLSEPDSLVTPGQSAVFYDGECIAFGGEIIEEEMK